MDETRAAITIQAYFRGYLARKMYAQELLRLIEREDAEMRDREREQLEEGELLIERYKLQQEIGDHQTLASNHTRRLNTMATRIQRSWRRRQARKHKVHVSSSSTRSSKHTHLSDADSAVADLQTVSVSTAPDETESSSAETVDDLARQVQAMLSYGSQTESLDEMYEFPEIPLDRDYDFPSLPDLEHHGVINSPSMFPTTLRYPSSFTDRYEDNNERSSTKIPLLHVQHHKQHSPPRKRVGKDRYRLLYSIELSDSSDDEATLPARQNGTDVLTSPEGSEIDLENGYGAMVTSAGLQQAEDPGVAMEFFDETPEEGTEQRQPPVSQPLEPKRTLMDHTVNPLHRLDVSQLKNLLQSLQRKVLAMSMSLVQLLEERDALVSDGDLLNANIAQMTRRVQDMYPKPKQK